MRPWNGSELRKLCIKIDPNGRPAPERWRRGLMRFFYPVQAYITKVLLTFGFTSLGTTILWCVVGVVASALLCLGSFIPTLIACALFYLQIALDGCDGEIARYNKRFVSREKDFELFVRGVYLDEICHLICSPARIFGVAFGIYTQTHRIEFIVCGILMAYLVHFRMSSAFSMAFVVNKLAHKLPESLNSLDGESDRSHWKESFFDRVIQTLYMYYVNGKMLLVAMTCLVLFDISPPQGGRV